MGTFTLVMLRLCLLILDWQKTDGNCYLRYDDTNPEAEKKEYIDHIEEIVKWMGWEPFKVTYTSDYFQNLFDLAVEVTHMLIIRSLDCAPQPCYGGLIRNKEYVSRIFLEGVLHWVAEPSPGVDPLKVEVRLFDKLFPKNPAELDDWLCDLNPNSKIVIPEAYVISTLQSAVLGDRFQFERFGYFAVDKDSTPEKLVFNLTVTLRDSYTKGGK